MFSFLLCLFVVLAVSYLGFEEGYLVLIAPVPGHCFLLLWYRKAPNPLNKLLKHHAWISKLPTNDRCLLIFYNLFISAPKNAPVFINLKSKHAWS